MKRPIQKIETAILAIAGLLLLSFGGVRAQPPPICPPGQRCPPPIEPPIGGRPTEPFPPPHQPGDPTIPTRTGSSLCRPVATGVSLDRVFVSCEEGRSTGVYIATVSPASQNFAAHVLSIAGAAHLSGKFLNISWESRVLWGGPMLITEIKMVDAP